jgi:hypothetical protein
MADTVNVTKNYIPQIDYVSRDYTAVLADLTAIARQFNPTWSVSDPTDIGVALLETFAYLGDILSFYTDRMASEGFLGTASQRASVLQIASMLGYAPTPSSAATVSLSLTNNNTSGTLVIPAGTQVASTTVVDGQSTQVVFELDNEISVGFGATATATATQGVTTTDEVLGTSSGTPSQVFKLAQPGVVINSSGSNITVKVGGIQYNYSSDLVDNNPYDSAFTITMDADGYTYIVFGDGVGGRIPPATYEITATYRVGVGSRGNIAQDSLAKNTLTGSYNVTINQIGVGTGGADQESTDSIRVNAPRALRTLRRAVSLKDYAYLALQVSGVSKANSDAAVWSNVSLYIAPFGSSAVNTFGPFTNITAISETAFDSTAGTGYLTYTVATNGLVANQSYVTVSGCVVPAYDINTPTLVTFADTTKFTVVKPASFVFIPNITASGTQPSPGGVNSSVSVTGSNTTAFNVLKTNVIDYFVDKVAPNVTLTVQPPVYVPVNLKMTLHVLPQYNQAAVVTQVQNALSNLVSYNNAFFADRIPPHFILNAITSIDGVDYATVDHLRRASNEQKYWTRSYTRTVNTATLTFSNVHTIFAGQTVTVDGVAAFDGTYAVNSVTNNTITITVPAGIATPSGVTTTSSSPSGANVINITTPAAKLIAVGMYVTGTNVPNGFAQYPASVTSVGTNSITIESNITTTITSGTALSFFWGVDTYANSTSVTAVDSTTSNGITTTGVVCAANEIPTKGTFTITATGGLQ